MVSYLDEWELSNTSKIEKMNKKETKSIIILSLIWCVILWVASYSFNSEKQFWTWAMVIWLIFWVVQMIYSSRINTDIEIEKIETKINDIKKWYTYDEDIDYYREELKSLRENYSSEIFRKCFSSNLFSIIFMPFIIIVATLILSFLSFWPTLKDLSGQPEWCNIKWNIEYEWTEKIYHVPWCSHYNETVINKDYWEMWFCSEQEARDAWWRKCREY